jgi:serine protease Do
MRKVSLRTAALAISMACVAAGSAYAQSTGSDREGRAWLGVYTQELDSDLRELLELPEGDGALITRVVPDSPAERAGLARRDLVVRFGTRDIQDPSDLTEAVRAAKVGETVPIVVVRDKARRTLNARLAERPEGDDEVRVVVPELEGDSFTWHTPHPDVERMVVSRWNPRGRLGVRVEELNPELATALGMRDGKGVLVLEVMKDTPAQKAGFKAGDVIVAVGNRNVATSDELVKGLSDITGAVKVTVVRKGQRVALEPKLEAREETVRVRAPRAFHFESWDPDAGRAVRDELRQMHDELRELRRRLEELERD